MATRHLLTETEYRERFPEKKEEALVSVVVKELCAMVEKGGTTKMPELKEPKQTADMVFLGVHKDYRGKNIANNFVRLPLPVFKGAGYTYASLFAVSHFSSRASEKNGFTSIFKLDVRNWIWKREKVLQSIREPHGFYKFRVKKL